MEEKKLNRADRYIADVVSGKQVTSKLVKLACQRHLDDLATGHLRDLQFSQSRADHIIDFIEGFCCHSQGKWAGHKVSLEPWQAALFSILYGWEYISSGLRRFRYAYIETAKGNGKSLVASCVGLYELLFEPGSEVYAVATGREQARICFSEAERMVSQSPDLAKRITNYRDSLIIAGTASKFIPRSSDSQTIEGTRVQCWIADEVSSWGSGARELWDALQNGLGKREQPLLFAITIPGSGNTSVAYQQHQYSEKVLSGIQPDDTWFSFIFNLDLEDDYQDPACWIKSNPNLGVTVQASELATVINKAKGDPASLNGVLRLRLGMWTSSSVAWLPADAWDKCGKESPVYTEADLEGQPCFAGLDLSTTTDISALVLLFPPYGERKEYATLCYFFLPKDNIERRSRMDRVPYDVWERQGLFCLTEGNIIDYAVIRNKIYELQERFDIREVAFDPWNATETATALDEAGLTTVKVRQGYETLSGPTKRLYELVISGQLNHGNNPVLRWMAGNVMVQTDANGNQRPDKQKSSERIDGIVSLICALSRAMVVPIETQTWAFAPFMA